MNKVEKFYTIDKLPRDVKKFNSHNVEVMFLSTRDKDETKAIVSNENGRKYFVFNGENCVLEKKDVDDSLFYMLTKHKVGESVKKEVSDIKVEGKDCKYFNYQGSLFGLQVVKVSFDNEQEMANFARPKWFKDEIKNKFYEKDLSKIISKDKE